jgi:hypothetical protein
MNKEKIEQLKLEIRAKQEECQKYCQEQFNLECSNLFRDNPNLESFNFRGWVPYFNDGEECVFSADTDYIEINGIDRYEVDGNDHPLASLRKKIISFLREFDDDFYRELFGSHFSVTVTKDKINVEEYTDHE